METESYILLKILILFWLNFGVISISWVYMKHPKIRHEFSMFFNWFFIISLLLCGFASFLSILLVKKYGKKLKIKF